MSKGESVTTESVPRVVLLPRSTHAQTTLTWDPESYVLSATLVRAKAEPASPLNLARTIDALHRIDENPYHIVVGDLEIEVDRERHPRHLSIRTNPKLWRSPVRLSRPAQVDSVDVELDVVYDENQIATFDAPVQLEHDPYARELRIRFGHQETVRWGAVSDDLWMGISASEHLSEIRLRNLQPPLEV